jgi:hypothetical protein
MKKSLQSNSKYNRYDLNKDGEVSDGEMQDSYDMLELELKEEKADTQKRMAWASFIVMVVVTVFLFLPVVSDSRVEALSDLLWLFYISQAGIIGEYLVVTAWMNKK